MEGGVNIPKTESEGGRGKKDIGGDQEVRADGLWHEYDWLILKMKKIGGDSFSCVLNNTEKAGK